MALRESQKRASLKWDKENMTVLSCKMKKEQAVAFRSYCEGRGKKSNTVLKDYVLSCIEERDSGGNPSESPWKGSEGPQGVGVVSLPSDTFEVAQRAAEAAGEKLPQFVARAVDAQAKRDEVTRRLEALQPGDNGEGVFCMNGNLPYQEEWPEELIAGKVVMMAPASMNHTFISGNIYHFFRNYLKGKNSVPIQDGAKVFLTDEDHFVPDFMVVCDRSKIKETGVYGAPDLVVEVLSHSTAKNDKAHKKDVYGRCGVREYWLVSPGDKSVEVYRNNGSELVFHDVYTLYPAWALAEMSEEKRAAVEMSFKCSLYDDLEISLEDIFSHTF